MGENSKIEWTHHTYNPWWGCVRVSPGCKNCYAEAFAKRTGNKVWGPESPRRVFGEKHWNEPRKWDAAAAKAGGRRRVFCASMADVFEDRRDLDPWRVRLWHLIAETPNLDWLLLTKRPECISPLAPPAWRDGWPSNAWLGTTVEDQQRADERIPLLLQVPAAVRFLSCEPLLGRLNLRHIDADAAGLEMCQVDALTGRQTDMGRPCPDVNRIDWVIVGGESGPGARPCNVNWIRSIVRQCREAGVPVFVKQLGAHAHRDGDGVDDDGGPIGYHCEHDGVAWFRTSDRKGGDMAEWPEDLRVRQWPELGHG